MAKSLRQATKLILSLLCTVHFAGPMLVAQVSRLQQKLEREPVSQLADDAIRFGDPVRGALAFYKPAMNCAKCHEQGRRERRLGPQLSEKREVEPQHLVQSVLRPSETIHEDYRTVMVQLLNGQTITGVFVSETEDAVVIDRIEQADGPHAIAKEEIDQWRLTDKSRMPEQLVNQLVDRGQFLDLIAYLDEIAKGGPPRAESLRPAGATAMAPLPEYESNVNHAGLLKSMDSSALKRGAEIYRLRCASCHGTLDEEGSMPTSLRFASGEFKNGSDPLAMYQTLTHGFGMMNAQRWMVPEQKYAVIHYIREHFLKPHNPDQYFEITDQYLASLPAGDTFGPRPTLRKPWTEMDYGPSLNNTIEVSSDGSNIAQKGIAIRLDHGPGGVESGRYWMLYDHDTMRVAGAWSGKFIDYNGIHFNGVHGRHPKVAGDVHLQNPVGPGFGRPSDGSFVDNRVEGRDGRRFGPLDREWAHFKGLYRFGQKAIIKYTVGQTEILESPRVEFASDVPVFVRTINIGPRSRDLVVQVARRPDSTFRLSSNDSSTAIIESREADKAISADGFLFDGVSYLQSDQSVDLTRDFALIARIKTTRDGTIFSQTKDASRWVPNGRTFFIRDGRLAFDIGWVGAVHGRQRVADGEWHEVAVSWRADEREVQFYVDGERDGRGGVLEVEESLESAVNRIGYTNQNFPEPSLFHGKIEDVRFYQQAFDESDLRHPPRKLLIGHWLGTRDAGHHGNPARSASPVSFERREARTSIQREFASLVANVTPSDAGQFSWVNGTDLRLSIPAGDQRLKLEIRTAATDSSKTAAVVEAYREPADVADLRPMTKGGPRNWPETLETQWQPGDNSQPFAADVLKRPVDNPWSDRLRLTGIDFLPESDDAIVSCWDGSIWKISGIQNGVAEAPRSATWQRIAAGLFQPLGIKIVEGKIYVTCRDQIVRLHDLNGDGEMDWYENFNNDHQVTEHFHEFAMGLQTDEKGNFYYAKSARHALPALVPHHGTLLKVTPDGSRTEILATGFRAPNGVCVNPDGTFWMTDQEGHWIPKNRINLVEPGKFYGNMYGYHDVEDSSDSAMEPPVCWITNSFDRSPSELLWVPDGLWGPFGGSLLNFSYGYGQIYIVPHEEVDGQTQGGMCAFPLRRFPTGVMRGRFNEEDGHLYCCGMFAWAGDQQQPGGLYRVRYTGRPAHLPISLEATIEGVNIELSETVTRQSAENPENYAIRIWDLKRTKNYGSKHYNEQRLDVESVEVADDGKTIKLRIPAIQPTRGMEIVYALEDESGKAVRGKIHNTIHHLGATGATD